MDNSQTNETHSNCLIATTSPHDSATHTGHFVCGLSAGFEPGVQVHLEGRSGRMKSAGSSE